MLGIINFSVNRKETGYHLWESLMTVERSRGAAIEIKQQKRADLVAEEIKRLITEKNLKPGDRLPREVELQEMFSVSKSTIREALKSLEVQGLIKVSTGPMGGGRVIEVPLDRTLQLMQNYLFFKDVTIDDIYAVRQLLEPELAAGAVPHLTEDDFAALERNIACCDPTAADTPDIVKQRQEINEMIRQLIEFRNDTPQREHKRFGNANVKIHKAIAAAARAGDAQQVRELMAFHMREATGYVKRMNGKLQGRLILDADIRKRVRARVRSAAGHDEPDKAHAPTAAE
jgi:GntR family transcriptional repressor for pyruvate dehydrogenase complex